MKEAYLDRLHEECERRRVHVPIPGRSFGKQESFEDIPLDGRNNQHLNDNSHQDTTVGSRRAPSFPRRSSMARKSDIGDGEASVAGSPGPAGASSLVGSSARAKLLAMQSRPSVASGTNGASGAGGAGNPSRRMMLLSSTETGERSSLRLLSSSSTSAAGNRRSAGIKLLDFEDLPATGIQAKRLRREQLEKEREEKRREREEKARERREARDAARQARLLAPGTNSKLANPSSPPLPLHNPPPPPPPPRLAVAPAKVPEIDESERMPQQPWTPFVVGPARNHHARHLPDEEDDDDDYDDEEEEGGASNGAFHLTAPRGFRCVISWTSLSFNSFRAPACGLKPHRGRCVGSSPITLP
uniref:HDAg domain-containing protein n=1 Tax=Mesocestoides corti TaxID=53468 RepID=A0A5K3EGB2_MESCO